MSHTRNPNQRTFFEVDQLLPRLPKEDAYCGLFSFFALNILPQLERHRPDLEGMYNADTGRRALDPVRMLGLTMLQYIEGVPDRQAESNCICDLRYKLALDLPLDKGLCDYSSLSRFRQHLNDKGLEDIGFAAVLKAMEEAGYLRGKTKAQRTDSTHVLGVVKVMGDLECGRETLRLALEAMDKQVAEGRPGLWGELWERYIENKPDYRMDKAGLKRRYRKCGEDAVRLLAWYDSLGRHGADEPKAVKLLRRFLAERFEVEGEGDGATVEEVAKLPTGIMRNPHEPEAEQRTKDSDKKKTWVGSLAQVSETVQEQPCEKGEPTPNVITAVVAQPASATDNQSLPQVEEARQSHGVGKPEVEYVDTGYVTSEELARFEGEGRELKGPAPKSRDLKGRFNVEDFEIDVENRRATCPGKNTNSQCSRLEEKATGKASFRFEFSRCDCQGCPLKDKCLGKGQEHRTVTVGEHHSLLQDRRKEQKTEAFKEDMKHRNGIEATISELVRGHGLRRSRYRGLKKTSLHCLMCGAACNIKRWYARITWENAQKAA
jgi:hypothetical protein